MMKELQPIQKRIEDVLLLLHAKPPTPIGEDRQITMRDVLVSAAALGAGWWIKGLFH